MTIQSIQKMMGLIALETLTALFESVARLGCGMAGIYYEKDN
jgi:hypothetical protein